MAETEGERERERVYSSAHTVSLLEISSVRKNEAQACERPPVKNYAITQLRN